MTTTPTLADTREELAGLLSDARTSGHRVGLVPTMGALHDGHAGLMREARARVGGGPVVASIFVNPLQFAPGEDLERYPRTLDVDLELCAAEGVDIVFVPGLDEVYPGGSPDVTVDPGPLAKILEGATRPTHFSGVLTVVAKLFGLVRPDVAVFGQKDYQQLTLIRRMVADLCMSGSRGGVDVVGVETVREPDGLAISSRNRYLDPEQRRRAVALHHALIEARDASRWGAEVALEAARAEMRRAHGVDLDYLVIRAADLAVLPRDVAKRTEGRILIAARLGSTRLIDNMPITVGAASAPAPAGEQEGDIA